MKVLETNIANLLKIKNKTNLVLIRHGQSVGNIGGSLHGWTDSKLSIQGRNQAHTLFEPLHKHIDNFDGIYSSDLQRCVETANISLGFPSPSKIKQDHRIREINFGKDEGLHYDTLSQAKKDLVDSIEYKAPDGQSWLDVRKRSVLFFSQLKHPGNYLIYTHGGLICTLTWFLGKTDLVPNCSAIGLSINEKTGEPENIQFDFAYPDTEEII